MLFNPYFLATVAASFTAGFLFHHHLKKKESRNRQFGGVMAGPDQYHYRSGNSTSYPVESHNYHSYTDFRFFERRFEREVEALMERSTAAENQGNVRGAIALAEDALREVDAKLGRDHYKAVAVLTRLGSLNFQEGFYGEAREYWEQALSVALEWPDRCRDDAEFARGELAKCSDHLGF